MLKHFLNLRLFGEGADGGDGAGEGQAGGEEIAIDARIPERAREDFKAAVRKNSPQQEESTPANVEKPEHVPFSELIKSDEYKEEHQAYMDKTIGDRLKHYKGLEAQAEKMRSGLSIVANKYGLDPSSENFLDELNEKLNSDNSYYESYAMEHNISPEDAKELLTLRQQSADAKRQQAINEQEARKQAALSALQANADRTKQVYPSFDLETEMQNPKFVQLCASTQGDVLAAYRVIHHEELLQQAGQQASIRAQQQVANAVAANKARPIENGLSSQQSTSMTTDWSKASLEEIRAYAESQRRLARK